MAMMMTTLLTMKEFYDAIENNDKVIVFYYTKWCPDCFAIKPFIPKLEEDFKDYTFYGMDRDSDIELAKHLNIFGIPSFLIFKNSEEIGRYVDKFRKTYQQVREFIDSVVTE